MKAKILDNTPNASVVKMPGRNYPGIVLQGDSIQIMLSMPEDELREELRRLGEHLVMTQEKWKDI